MPVKSWDTKSGDSFRSDPIGSPTGAIHFGAYGVKTIPPIHMNKRGNSRFVKRNSENLRSSHCFQHMCTNMMYGKFGRYHLLKEHDVCAQVWRNLQNSKEISLLVEKVATRLAMGLQKQTSKLVVLSRRR